MGKVFTITEGLENMGALKTGGQGSVYKGRRVGPIITAVKLLPTPIHSESPADKNFIDFQNEVQKLKKVNEQPNPNVVKILSSGITETGNLPFIEMEFIEGHDLEELLHPPHDPVFTIKEVIKVADQLSHALAHCHRVDVKHGDIKSNNVKLNVHTGNYVLLDFGLAAMSDEQRRTSLRHAGAIEFMAPEQNEGHLYFQTDVYSFGIILYELVAGVVPFPLKDKGETARNMVRIAHMETKPPDVLLLRQQHLPATWSAARKEQEMNVPDWLIDLIYKCLEKKPEHRFRNGMELHEYVVLNSTMAANKKEWSSYQSTLLQQENDKLLQEKQQLQQLLAQYQDTKNNKEQELSTLKMQVAQKDNEIKALRDKVLSAAPPKVVVRKGVAVSSFILLLLVTLGLGVLSVYLVFKKNSVKENAVVTKSQPAKPMTRKVVGQYKVAATKAYFYNEPDENARRNAYMVPSADIVNALDEENGFVYTEFTNNKGQTSKGWLRREDLMTLAEWDARNQEPEPPKQLSKIEINAQLQRAKALLESNNTEEALSIYKPLADMEVPEAMYQYGNQALQGKNSAIDCGMAIDLVKRASDMDYTEAKRTMGFLYLFAENKRVLQLSNYDNCSYEKNIIKGTKLLMDAILSGDTAANKILEMHKAESESPPPPQ